MIAKFIAVLALVAQINGLVSNNCGSLVQRVVVTGGMNTVSGGLNAVNGGLNAVNGGLNAVSSGLNAVSGGLNAVNGGLNVVSGGMTSAKSGSSGVFTRNVVVKGKFPVALSNCGPTPDKQIPVTTSHVKAPLEVKPTVRLPYQVPAPRTVSHTCTCYKTVLRPRVHEQVITVPSVQRYVETTHKPVVEHIHYEATPTNCNDNSGFVFTRVNGNGLGLDGGLRTLNKLGGQVYAGVQALQLPQVQSVQSVQVPRLQSVQSVQLPRVQTVQVSQVPSVQTVQVPDVQTVQSLPVQQVSSVSSQCRNNVF